MFNILLEAAKRGELLLVDGGICYWKRPNNNTINIIIIIATKTGMGSFMLGKLKELPGVTKITASCHKELPSNAWYIKKGFRKVNENDIFNSYELIL